MSLSGTIEVEDVMSNAEQWDDHVMFTESQLEAAVAREREECAVQADVNAQYFMGLGRDAAEGCFMTADMIRARSGPSDATRS